MVHKVVSFNMFNVVYPLEKTIVININQFSLKIHLHVMNPNAKDIPEQKLLAVLAYLWCWCCFMNWGGIFWLNHSLLLHYS
jgi:hypothetical protein